jgi:hypothetical protein
MVFKPQRFKGCLFPRSQVKPTLLGPVDRASLYRWTTTGGNFIKKKKKGAGSARTGSW